MRNGYDKAKATAWCKFKGNFNSKVKGAQLKLAATNSIATSKAGGIMGVVADSSLDLKAELSALRELARNP